MQATGVYSSAMEPPPAPAAAAAASLTSHRPAATAAAASWNAHTRPSGAGMRHSRTLSRTADVLSRASDEDGGRTAVKVAVRVRPSLKPTDPGFDLIPQRFRGSTCDVSTATNLTVQSPQGKKHFVFDRVFDEQTTQEGVWEYVSGSVSSFVKGYNVSILAYGQSGAGKSYTMGTSGPDDQVDAGIVPRAAQALFDRLNGTTPKHSGIQTPKRYSIHGQQPSRAVNGAPKNWELKATYVEIYNEQLRDLLLPETVPRNDRAQVAIREDTKGRIMLTGMTQVPLNSPEDILSALSFGSAIRQTDATAINARSSRSHAVFSLILTQKKSSDHPPLPTSKAEKRRSVPVENPVNADHVVTIESKLHFVDLAGSERLKNTNATGDRAKEGISINAGLASLGKVISQLSSKQGSGYISYRDSRLTRLLQDSLGGTAITYMVACVTPAIFHLSETLNTVHYAQRARAIQSKPEIQQVHEEGDRQATIDRLRAEVSFLRLQIRSAENQTDRNADTPERAGRLLLGKERELHSQLMDMQENYNALSHRHAKLISEISRSRDGEEADTPLLNEAIGDNASERIKRSNSFAEAVESVVLEYEKTIQTLEASLNTTRSNLASTESTLMQRETRIAYMDTIQQQLQARVAKYLERENTNESYMRELEEKIEGAGSEDEKRETVMVELRKELARVRESEASAEDYISTLEERLAEAEQDSEIMQREINRLQHVVERQRSIGRLDNILGELDGVRADDVGANRVRSATLESPANDAPSPVISRRSSSAVEDFEAIERPASLLEEEKTFMPTDDARSPTQNDFMAEKLESLTQEFFDLHTEHESVIMNYDNLQQKYRTALETLAKLEYDKAKRPDTPEQSNRGSILAGSGKGDEEKATNGRSSASQLLIEDLSLSQESPNTGGDAEKEPISSERVLSPEPEPEPEAMAQREIDRSLVSSPVEHEDMLQEMDTLRKLHAEKEVSVAELTKNYMSLAQRHETTLTQVEELKQEVQKSQRAQSPTFPASPAFSKSAWRRKSDDLLGGGSDRASRSFVSMKTMVFNNFEDQTELRQTFEQHLSTVMTELQGRSERVTALEAELATIKKEMDNKQQIITGLTRERSSLAAVSAHGVDFSVVGQMREQLVESEKQIRTLQEQHLAREKELQVEIDSLKSMLSDHQEMLANQNNQLPTPAEESALSQIPGNFPVTPSVEPADSKELASNSLQADEISRLQREVTAWENKHREVMDTMTASENDLLSTITELQKELHAAENNAAQSVSTVQGRNLIELDVLEQERAKNKQLVDNLTNQVIEHRKIADERVTRLEHLQEAYTHTLGLLEHGVDAKESTEKELSTHKDLVMNLESQLQVHKSAIAIHQESLESLQSSHTKEIDQLTETMKKLENDSTEKYEVLQTRHEKMTSDLAQELSVARSEVASLLQNASSALGYETDPSKIRAQIHGLVEEGKELHGRHLKTTNELKVVQEELQSAINRSVEMETQMTELKTVDEERGLELAKLKDKYAKSAALVEQLEEQLNTNFDTHRETNKRMSSLQTEQVQARIELERELEDQKLRYSQLQQQLDQYKHMSTTSTGSAHVNNESLSPDAATSASALGRSSSGSSSKRRKSGPTALPTAPPSIPLPPLPASPLASTFANPTSPIAAAFGHTFEHSSPTPRGTSPAPGNSPPESRHGSHEVGPSPATAQLIEEQEARIRTIEKHLFAEKQLTATLEEALVDLETSANRTKSEMENWRKKCQGLEDELVGLRKERTNSRASLQAVEEEREMRVRAEMARQALEQRMAELNVNNKKKKKNALNCF